MRGGSLGYGIPGGTQSGSATVNGYTVPQDLTLTGNRTGAQPAEYVAANNVEFTGEFESASSDEFTAYIADASYAGTGNQSNGGSGPTLAGGYRYGFNGKENDADVKGDGNEIDYGMRIFDPRLCKFLSLDPLQTKYPWFTPYQFAGNSPIANVDVDGREDFNYNLVNAKNSNGDPVLAIVFDGKKDIGFLTFTIRGNINGGNTELHTLYYQGQPIASFMSFQQLKEQAHGKTINQIKAIQEDNNADAFNRVQTFESAGGVESGEPVNPARYSSRKPNQNQQLLKEAEIENPTGLATKQASSANNGVNTVAISSGELAWIKNFVKNKPGTNIGIYNDKALISRSLNELSKQLGGVEVAQVFIKTKGGGYYNVLYGTRSKIEIPQFEGTPYLINHVHPSGNDMPSDADKDLLKELQLIQKNNGMPIQKSSQIVPTGNKNKKFNTSSKTKGR